MLILLTDILLNASQKALQMQVVFRLPNIYSGDIITEVATNNHRPALSSCGRTSTRRGWQTGLSRIFPATNSKTVWRPVLVEIFPDFPKVAFLDRKRLLNISSLFLRQPID